MSSRMYRFTVVLLACVTCAMVVPGATDDKDASELSMFLTRRYAETYLELAEVQLEKRLNANKKVPGVYSKREIDRSRMNVAVAKEQLLLVTAPEGDAILLHAKHAQEQAIVTDADYQRALKANAVFAGTYSELLIKELRLEAEVAELRVAIWSNPKTNVLSLLDHMHWQLERVSEEVLDLQKRVNKLEVEVEE